MIEIERKFLVTSLDFIAESSVQHAIAQGYLNSDPERTVRIRIKGEKGYITIKGSGNETGTSRMEWEKEISLEEAKSLLKLCEKGVIEKTRYEVKSGIHIIEIDVFHGENEGLIMAEVELEDENEAILKPNWLGKEVTGDTRYYNSYISKHTLMYPAPLLEAMEKKAFLDKSISLPLTNGPLSVISTTTVFPVAILVALILVPKGSVLCAAVSSYIL
jgi:CYTH domain-containing protein